MGYQNHKIFVALSLLSALLVIIKLFTAIVMLEEGPTIFLVFRYTPSFETILKLKSFYSIESNNLYVLMLGENGFIGEGLHYLITKFLWWILPLCLAVFSTLKTTKLISRLKVGR